jgi:hypothetical protein
MLLRKVFENTGTKLTVALLAASMFMPACKTMPWNKGGSNQPVAEQQQNGSDPLMAPGTPSDSKGSYSAPVVEQQGLSLSPDQRFKDIPLPVGMKEDMERTFVYQSSSIEVGRMVYTSRATVFDLAQFFLKECPTAGWKLKNVLEAEAKTLIFTKSNKELEVIILPLGVAAGRRVSITLRPSGGEVGQ